MIKMMRLAGRLLVISSMVACLWGGGVVNPAYAAPAQAGETWSAYGLKVPASGSMPGAFNAPFHVAFDDEDNLYVADLLNHRIQKLTAATGEWTEWGKAGGVSGNGLGEFSGPSGVAIDAHGNLYVADTDNHRIQKLTAATGEWSAWGKEGGGSGNAPGEFFSPGRIAFDAAGKLYVTELINHRVQIYNPETAEWSEWGAGGGQSGTGLGQFFVPYGLAFDPVGNLYVSDSGNSRIQRRDAVTGEWSQYGKSDLTQGSALGEFSNARDVATDAAGNLYVADSLNHRVQKLDIGTNVWSEWKKSDGGSGAGPGEFNQPSGLAFDSNGNLYIADRSNHRLQILSASDNTWTSLMGLTGSSGTEPGQFGTAYGVALDRHGNVYVADTNNHRIQVLHAQTGEWTMWGSESGSGTGLGEFSSPYSVSVDAAGNVYVADGGNHRIQKRDAVTGQWTQWGKEGGDRGTEPGEFNTPRSVVADGAGNIYVADTNNHRIQMLDPSTDTWTIWGKAGGGNGNALGEFSRPFNVAVNEAGDVYVADTFNHRVQKRDVATGVWSSWVSEGGGSGSGLGEFNRPAALALDELGNLYVTEALNHRLQRLTVATGEWQQWGKAGGGSGSLLGEFNTPSAVAVSADGRTLYIMDTNNYRLVKLVLPAQKPAAPANVSAEAGNGQALVSFDAPQEDGGSPVVSYTVTAWPGGQTAMGSESPITVRGLTNGQSYTFTVVATTSAHSSDASAPSNAVVPRQPSSGGGTPVGNPPVDSPPADADSPVDSSVEEARVSVFVNGKEVNAGKMTESRRENNRTVVTVALDPLRLEDMLTVEGTGAVVTIPIAAEHADAVVGELNGQMVKSMEGRQAVLRIVAERGTYTLPAEMINIDALSSRLGAAVDREGLDRQDLDLQDIRIAVEIAAPEADMRQVVEQAAENFTLIGAPVKFTVTATYGEQTVAVTVFNAYVERTLALPNDVDPEQITTAIVIEPDGATRHVPTKITVIDGRHYAVVNSFTNSVYAVIWNPVQFVDMDPHWAKEAVNALGSRKAVRGVGGGAFGPEASITRHEFAAILVRSLGLKPEAGAHTFPDVDNLAWYAPYVSTAYTYGLVSGHSNGNFSPFDSITREQAISILARAMASAGLEHTLTGSEQADQLARYADADSISGYAREAVAASVKLGILTGRSADILAPQAVITRAEAVTMMIRLLRQAELID